MAVTDRRDGDWRRATVGRVWMAAALVLVEVALILVASVAWASSPDVSTAWISLLGGSAIAGILVLVVIGLANARALRSSAARARGLAIAGQWLALLRLLGLLVAAVAIVVASGLGGDLADACTLGVAVFDGLLAIWVAFWTGRALASQQGG
jgi:hypothetical protein